MEQENIGSDLKLAKAKMILCCIIKKMMKMRKLMCDFWPSTFYNYPSHPGSQTFFQIPKLFHIGVITFTRQGLLQSQ